MSKSIASGSVCQKISDLTRVPRTRESDDTSNVYLNWSEIKRWATRRGDDAPQWGGSLYTMYNSFTYSLERVGDTRWTCVRGKMSKFPHSRFKSTTRRVWWQKLIISYSSRSSIRVSHRDQSIEIYMNLGDGCDVPTIVPAVDHLFTYTHYWTVPLILDYSYIVGKWTNSKIADRKVSGF